MKRTLRQIQQWLQVEGQHLDESIVTGVTIDSRNVQRGDLFIPFRGERVNGHQYVEQAIKEGAVASFWLQDEPNPPANVPLLFVQDAEKALQLLARRYREQMNATVIGVTGSNGKTSTKDFIASIMAPYRRVAKTEGNYNNELGLPITLLNMPEDTEVAIVEMGMSGFGEIAELSQIAHPHIAVITNIGEAHMEDLGSREGIARAKFEIVQSLATDGILLYDGDEPLLTPLVQKWGKKAIDFGLETSRAIYPTHIDPTEDGMRFRTHGVVEGTFVIPVYGEHQVQNALIALLVAHRLGLTVDEMAKALRHATLTPMRMQPVVLKDGTLCLNDAYNAAPTSVEAAITFMNETTLRPRKWLVLGDMLELGPQSKTYHEQIVDRIDPNEIEGVVTFGSKMKDCAIRLKETYPQVDNFSSEDEDAIVEYLQKIVGNETLLLVKGSRGMRMERFIDRLQKEER